MLRFLFKLAGSLELFARRGHVCPTSSGCKKKKKKKQKKKNSRARWGGKTCSGSESKHSVNADQGERKRMAKAYSSRPLGEFALAGHFCISPGSPHAWSAQMA